jgi:hypothetical protein
LNNATFGKRVKNELKSNNLDRDKLTSFALSCYKSMASRHSLNLSCSPVDNRTYLDFIGRLEANNEPAAGSPPDPYQPSLLESNLRGAPSWAPDDAVSHCNNCHLAFSLFWRKHHCRYCGRIFCDPCSKWRAKLPRDLDNFPKTPEQTDWFSYLRTWQRQSKKAVLIEERVCETCKHKVDKLWSLSSAIRIVTHMRLDLEELSIWGCLSKEWSEAVRCVRLMHRNLQFRLPWYQMSHSEIGYLHRNLMFFSGHNRWVVLLLKSVRWHDPYQSELALNLLSKTRCCPCQVVHSRTGNCHETLQLEDIVELLTCRLPSSKLRSWLIERINAADDLQFECLIPILCSELKHERADHKRGVLGLLIQRAKQSSIIRNIVFWNLIVMKKRDPVYVRAYEKYLLTLHNELGEAVVYNELIRGRNIVKSLEQMPNPGASDQSALLSYFRNALQSLSPLVNDEDTKEDSASIADMFTDVETGLTLSGKREIVTIHPTILPGAPDHTAIGLDLERIRVKSSATCPVVLSFITDTNAEVELLYKKECLLKDQIALYVIRLMDNLLKRDLGTDFHIVTYRILPTGEAAGLVEMIPNSETIYSIIYKKNRSLLNWILDHARGRTVESIRDHFVKSTAAYCVISYLLAVGDRHLDNIMVTDSGHLFHIDYSFFMGFDPKPLAPYMRITQDIVDALGGIESQDYMQFKECCSKVYNCLRQYTNLFACLLRLITEDELALDGGCFTRDRLEEELLHRFVPSESIVEAELQLLNRLEDSYRSSTPQFCIDFWHYHSRHDSVGKVLSKMPSWGFTSLWPFSKS